MQVFTELRFAVLNEVPPRVEPIIRDQAKRDVMHLAGTRTQIACARKADLQVSCRSVESLSDHVRLVPDHAVVSQDQLFAVQMISRQHHTLTRDIEVL